MEKVNLFSCVQNPLYISNVKQTAPSANEVSFKSAGGVTDTVSLRTQKERYLDELNKLFPDGGFDGLCNRINKDFGIDKPAQVKLVSDDDGVVAGGFNFNRNEITLSLSDLLGSDTKIVGIKDGKRTVLTSPSVKLPLFIDKKNAENFLTLHSQHGNLGFDKLVAEPVTEDDKRKFIAQKVAHEIIHSQQHMIMRKTEGIGEKEVIKAWTHGKPKNMIENYLLNLQTEKMYNNSYWKTQPETEQSIKQNSPASALAKIWLEAVRNYPPVDSPEYTQNPIERDAYIRSAQYVYNKYGAWS